jgi:hypothetical protein
MFSRDPYKIFRIGKPGEGLLERNLRRAEQRSRWRYRESARINKIRAHQKKYVDRDICPECYYILEQYSNEAEDYTTYECSRCKFTFQSFDDEWD